MELRITRIMLILVILIESLKQKKDDIKNKD